MQMPSPKDLFHAAIAVILLLSVGAGQIPTASPLTERSSKVWSGHYAEDEEFLGNAVGDRTIDRGAARRVFFKPGRPAASGALKSHATRSQIPWYRLARGLCLGMRPP